MDELFVGVVEFESDGLDEPFDNQVYVLAADDGLAPHTISDSNSIIAPSASKAADKALAVLEATYEDEIKQLYDTMRELDESEPWSEVLDGKLATYDVTFSRDEAARVEKSDALKNSLHHYLVQQHHIYRPYSLKVEAYHADKLPDWKEPAEETGLLDQYIDYDVNGMDTHERLPDRLQFLNELHNRLAGEE